MLAVLASPHDRRARDLVDRWARWDAALLSAGDLSRPGWRHDLRSPGSGTAVIGGRPVPVADLAGVLVLWPAVFEQELLHIVPAERSYVAAEMTAFLRSWLSQLPCPVLNRPTATSLSGPSWRPEQWVHAASRLGIPVRPVRRRARLVRGDAAPVEDLPGACPVTVVGRRCIGDVDTILAAHARRLAVAADVELLTVYFLGGQRDAPLLTADPMPDVTQPDLADAIRAHLLGASVATTGERRP